MNLSNKQINEIKTAASEKFDGDLQLAAAAHVHGEMIIRRCGGRLPLFADMDKIGEIVNQINAVSASEPQTPETRAEPDTLEIVKDSFTTAELLEIVEQASRNQREIGREAARAIYGDAGLIAGKINPLADNYKIGQVRGQITRLLSKLQNEVAANAETSSDAPETSETGDSVSDNKTEAGENPDVSIATETQRAETETETKTETV